MKLGNAFFPSVLSVSSVFAISFFRAFPFRVIFLSAVLGWPVAGVLKRFRGSRADRPFPLVSSLTAYTNTDSDGSRHALDRECGPSAGIGADWKWTVGRAPSLPIAAETTR